ncbi:unnamed protein product, partial [Iphiclides podalirius]
MLTALKNAKKSKENADGSSNDDQRETSDSPDSPPKSTSRKLPLHECLILELKEAGFFESSDYLRDLVYDNVQILAEDEIGIVIDIREREDYLEHVSAGLQRAERERDKAGDVPRIAEAVVEIGISQLAMNNLNNAQKSFEKAYKIYASNDDVNGLCETKMHLAAVMQRLSENERAAKLLTEMGALAMEQGLCKQLGRALQLLGELHLRRERPDLGTQHLAEAFSCFMGYIVHGEDKPQIPAVGRKDFEPDLDVIYKIENTKVYVEEAEQSRIMMAISAGQELMASYFKLIETASACFVAKVQLIEWKLAKSGWWIEKEHHRFIPCLCPVHNRTPLDVLWLRMAPTNDTNVVEEEESNPEKVPSLNREATVDDMRKLRSSFVQQK